MRRAWVGIAAVSLAVGLTACTTEPAPSSTPTGFADEDAAFAAAEATYRAYIDALNRVDLSDPETFEDVYRWTTGELNASDRKGLSEYFARGLQVTGESRVASLDLHAVSPDLAVVSIDVCLDVSDVDLKDAAGVSQVAPDRVDVQRLRAELNQAQPASMRLTAVRGREDGREC